MTSSFKTGCLAEITDGAYKGFNAILLHQYKNTENRKVLCLVSDNDTLYTLVIVLASDVRPTDKRVIDWREIMEKCRDKATLSAVLRVAVEGMLQKGMPARWAVTSNTNKKALMHTAPLTKILPLLAANMATLPKGYKRIKPLNTSYLGEKLHGQGQTLVRFVHEDDFVEKTVRVTVRGTFMPLPQNIRCPSCLAPYKHKQIMGAIMFGSRQTCHHCHRSILTMTKKQMKVRRKVKKVKKEIA